MIDSPESDEGHALLFRLAVLEHRNVIAGLAYSIRRQKIITIMG